MIEGLTDSTLTPTPGRGTFDDMDNFISRSFGAVTMETLGKLTMAQLVTLYNEAKRTIDPPVREFADYSTALKVVIPLLFPDKGERVYLTVEGQTIENVKRRRKPYRLPCKRRSGNIRPGTTRGRLVEILVRPEGATFNECMAETRLSRQRLMAEITGLNLRFGFGVHEDDDGTIRLITEDKGGT